MILSEYGILSFALLGVAIISAIAFLYFYAKDPWGNWMKYHCGFF
jgi:hypothetical protein